MKIHRICGAIVASLGALTAGSAYADSGGTIVLNTFNKVLPQMIGDGLGPTKVDTTTGKTVPRVGRCTGVGFMDAQLKIDSSPTAVANAAKDVPLLITATRTDNQVNANSNNSYMQGAFAVVHLLPSGPALDAMQYVALPRLDGDRAWQKPNVFATDKYYALIGATEDNGDNNNPQAAIFVMDKTTLKMVKVLTTNRDDSLTKPTNLITLSGNQDGQQYGPHSIAAVPGAPNSFVLGLQRNNTAAYTMRVDLKDGTGGVSVSVPYLTEVLDTARHSRPDIVTNPATPNIGYLTTVEANNQPADIGVRVLSFDLTTGKAVKSVLVAKSNPGANKYVVQPNIADLGSYLAVSYQMSERTRADTGNGHTGGSNLSMLQLIDKTTLANVGTPVVGPSPYARHTSTIATMYGGADAALPAILSMGGSSTGTGKGYGQIIQLDTTAKAFGTKDPAKLYEMSLYSDVAGVVTRGKRNPNDQGRGFIYAQGMIQNPGYNGGNTAFMPEVKTFTGAAIQGYTNDTTVALAARESIWLSLIPSTWVPGATTTPGNATDKPGVNPDGTGPLPRVDQPGTNPDPNAPPGSSVPPPGNSSLNDTAPSGCACHAVSSSGAGAGSGSLFLLGLGILGLRRRAKREG